MLKAAWILAHDQSRFQNMKAELGCPLASCLSASSSDVDKSGYFSWLAGTSSDGNIYNIHAVWIWYYEHKYGKVLPFGPSV
jgi:hypothetical protein